MSTDSVFAGSIPELYDTLVVPMMFLDYAEDVAAEVASAAPHDVLETAAGTGAVTRSLHRLLPSARITATDLSPGMLDRAATVLPSSDLVRWIPADAQDLPFDDASFDAVMCQFGVMFFPDRPGAYAQVRRVLRPGGRHVMAVWGRIEDNEASLAVAEALTVLFVDDPPQFLRRTPFGYTDVTVIRTELEDAGFTDVSIRTVTHHSRPTSARDIAVAHCQGTPLAHILAERHVDTARTTAELTRLLEARWGTQPYVGRLSAHVVTAVAA
ncbi:class I SAM-dependent methyltransferase [Janibacter sp. DB-40]|uniref:class I SAM-dependent methyltransferase n=1 Tax=Janibacter sp. DB-40 TaxID=3028808 RepID=UPI002406F588|nr:class I SAM-dependent methyltransferase [Janibacter sp. DB-40]